MVNIYLYSHSANVLKIESSVTLLNGVTLGKEHPESCSSVQYGVAYNRAQPMFFIGPMEHVLLQLGRAYRQGKCEKMYFVIWR